MRLIPYSSASRRLTETPACCAKHLRYANRAGAALALLGIDGPAADDTARSSRAAPAFAYTAAVTIAAGIVLLSGRTARMPGAAA
jgi:hypothetical protein